MIFVVIIGILLVAIVIMLFFKNVTTFISLLTALSTLMLGVYQLSKDKRRVDFTIIFTDSPPPKGLGSIMIANTGYLPVYFNNFFSKENKQEILVYADTEEINIFKKFLHKLNRQWFSPFKKNLMVEDFVIQDKPHEGHSYSIMINSGNYLQHNFNSWDYKGFFEKGKRFFIPDGSGNIFYLKQESVDAIKKILKKYETGESDAK